MANAMFAAFKNALLDNTGVRVDFTSEIRATAVLVDHGVATPDPATHDFFNDITAAVVETKVMTTTTVGVPAAGVFDAEDTTFLATSGADCESIVVYDDNGGADTVLPLAAFWDTAGGLPVTLGGDVTIVWDSGANRIFAF